MNKLNKPTPDLTQKNVEKIAELFPNVITEKEDQDGKIEKAVDFDLLRQALSKEFIEGPDERYRLDWPGKRASLLKANTPITKTLRPDYESSEDFDTTQNVFIEGDNFEALKILQESYLGKVKMIYIDPPYNTGKDFVYRDNFTQDKGEYEEEIEAVDEEGNKMFRENTRTNPRFHSDWLSMMYERLIIARDLLRDDGVIFISIDDNEVHNLRKVCDEIFGEDNFINSLLIRRRVKSLNVQFAESGLRSFNVGFEYVLVYTRSQSFKFEALRMKKKNYTGKGSWNVFWSGADRPTMRYEVLGFTPQTGQWRWSEVKAQEAVANYEQYLNEFSDTTTLEEYWETTGKILKFIRKIDGGEGKNGGVQYWVSPSETTLRTSNWTDIEVSEIGKEFDLPFSNPKNKVLIQTLLQSVNDKDALIIDVFSGSSTTAHAVMQQNAEDGGNRKFIMVQLAEETPEGSDARKAGFNTIDEIGRERIRRAGAKIKTDYAEKLEERETPLDTGFRVYTVADTSFLDVEKHPGELEQGDLLALADNIKEDRTPADLLTQVMLELGLTLDLPIETRQVQEKTVFYVAGNALVACFDEKVPLTLIDEMAKCEPLQVVFKDASFGSDDDLINAETHLKRLSPDTTFSVI